MPRTFSNPRAFKSLFVGTAVAAVIGVAVFVAYRRQANPKQELLYRSRADDQFHLSAADGSGSSPVMSWSDYTDPMWSPDGGRLAFISKKGGTILISDVYGSAIREIPTPKGPLDTYSWSPDSSQLAFVHRWADQEILVTDIDQGTTRRLTTGHHPMWSNDGKQLVFEAGNGLHLIGVDGRNERPLMTGDARAMSPIWLRDGRIVFQSNPAGSWNIYTVRPEDGTITQLTNSTANSYFVGTANFAFVDPRLAVDPQGGRILFMSDRDGTDDIYVMNTDGSSQRRLTKATNQSLSLPLTGGATFDLSVPGSSGPAWSPSGREVVYVQRDGKKQNIYKLVLEDDGAPIRVLSSALSPRWRPHR